MRKDVMSFVGLVLLGVLLIVCGPIAVIWGLNTIFPVLAIPYNFWTWLAMWVVQGAVRTPISFRN